MKQIGVVGSRGMLGNAICQLFDQLGIQYITFDRTPGPNPLSNFKFEISRNHPKQIFEILGSYSVVINCAGLTTQKLNQSNPQDIINAYEINSIFPRELNIAAKLFNSRVIQVGTDCVFSGNSMSYSESSFADPENQYGITKYLGEIENSEGLILRTSLVGMEVQSNFGLLSWFLSHPKGSTINGYTNHIWNGVTTLAAAKVIAGILRLPEIPTGKFHLVPNGELSKYQLLSIFSSLVPDKEYTIVPTKGNESVNRTLHTEFSEVNESFWKNGGYEVRPTHLDLISEYLNWVDMKFEKNERKSN